MNLTRLSPQELKQRIEQGSVRLVDVREADEFARVHISSAESNPLSKFDVHACQRPGAQPVLYCRSGARIFTASCRRGRCQRNHKKERCYEKGPVSNHRHAGDVVGRC